MKIVEIPFQCAGDRNLEKKIGGLFDFRATKSFEHTWDQGLVHDVL